MEPITFAHLTDTHINAPAKNNPMFGLDMTAKLRTVFAHLRSLQTKPLFVVISGDLTQDGDLEDYRYLKTIIDEEAAATGVPVYVGLGNHDSRAPFREGYLGEAPSEESYYYSITENGLRIIMLNSQIPASHDGKLDEAQLNWLKQTLAEPAERGSIVVIHHPATATPTSLMDSHLLQNPAELAQVLQGTDCIGLLSGHIHFHNVGILEVTLSCAATGVAFGLDPTAESSMRFLDNSGYNLVTVKNGSMLVQPQYLPGEHRVVYELDVSKTQIHA